MSLFRPRSLERLDKGAIPILNDNFNKLFRLLTGGIDYSNSVSSGFLQTWQDSSEDNIDETNGMFIDIYLPSETRYVHKVLLRFRKKKFRADATTAASGGGQTTSSGGGTTTSSGGGINQSSASGGGFTKTSGDDMTTHSHDTSGAYTDYQDGTGSHRHSTPNDVTYANSTHHQHSLTLEDHTHNVTVASHDHSIGNHSHTVANHTHDLSYGIYEAALPATPGLKVYVNGINRTTELGGPWNVDVDELDLTGWFNIGQWNTVEIGCGTGILVRVHAQVFIQAFIEPIGRLQPKE